MHRVPTKVCGPLMNSCQAGKPLKPSAIILKNIDAVYIILTTDMIIAECYNLRQEFNIFFI